MKEGSTERRQQRMLEGNLRGIGEVGDGKGRLTPVATCEDQGVTESGPDTVKGLMLGRPIELRRLPLLRLLQLRRCVSRDAGP